MFVRNRWDSYTSSPPNKDGKMVHFGFCAVSSMISGWGGGDGGFAVSFFMILSKIVLLSFPSWTYLAFNLS